MIVRAPGVDRDRLLQHRARAVEPLQAGQHAAGRTESQLAVRFDAEDLFEGAERVLGAVQQPENLPEGFARGQVVGTVTDRRLKPGQLVVLESTTYPGTTEELLKPILEQSGLRAGQDFFLAFSPEREDPGNAAHSVHTIPKVVGGLDAKSGDLAAALYGAVVPRVVRVSTPEVAEAAPIPSLDGPGGDAWEPPEPGAAEPEPHAEGDPAGDLDGPFSSGGAAP